MEGHQEDPKIPADLIQRIFDDKPPSKEYGNVPPDNTVSMNALVILLYFLLYSTVHHFSCIGVHPCAFNFNSVSSSVSGRRERPSRPLAAHHDGCGRVRWDLTAGTFFRLDDCSALFAVTTRDPKNLRISASPSRFWRETERRSARDCFPVSACDIFCDAGYLSDSYDNEYSVSKNGGRCRTEWTAPPKPDPVHRLQPSSPWLALSSTLSFHFGEPQALAYSCACFSLCPSV
jgi:hypothetical protein